ncbi:MAG: protein kinase domain-containing protein [Candidatus Woesearchaeota archaeon]
MKSDIIKLKLMKQIMSDDRFFHDTLKHMPSGNDTKLILPLTFFGERQEYKKNGGLECHLKILFDTSPSEKEQGKAKDRAQLEYDIYNSIEDKSKLVKLVGFKPEIFQIDELQTVHGVLSQTASDTFRRHYLSNNLNEKEILDVIFQAAKGLSELDKKGFQHRDIKASNIFYYEDIKWVLADFGNSGQKDRFETSSSKNDHLYWSPHAIKHNTATTDANTRGTGAKYKYTPQEDIWQLGLTLYDALKQSGEPILRSEYLQSGFNDYQEFVYNTINKSGFNDEIKYYLKRLLGADEETTPIKNETHKRYKNIAEFIDDYTGEREKIILAQQKILDFKEKANNFKKLINDSKQQETGPFKTINYKTIDKIVNGKTKLEELANEKGIRESKERNEVYHELVEDQYMQIIKQERQKLLKQTTNIQKLITNNNIAQAQQLIRPLYEITFLWGPPLTNKTRDTQNEKSRYTLNEILNMTPHFYKTIGGEKYTQQEKKDLGAI